MLTRLRRWIFGAPPVLPNPIPTAVPVPTGTHSSIRINQLAGAIGARSYLEIGVETGATFFNVAIPQKVAVDPAFAFDMAAGAAPGLSFHPIPSDDYFALAGDAHFDIAFIDGFHTFDQAERDFRNVLRHVGADSLILIDDTLPSDAFSAESPTGDEAVRRRRAAGQEDDLSWHGDVYKLVFALHDLWPGFDFRTIADGVNSQTLVWQTPLAVPRTPRFGSQAAIAALGWTELQANLDLLRLTPEAEAIALCLAGRAAAIAARTA